MHGACFLVPSFATTFARAGTFCKNLEMELGALETAEQAAFAQLVLAERKSAHLQRESCFQSELPALLTIFLTLTINHCCLK